MKRIAFALLFAATSLLAPVAAAAASSGSLTVSATDIWPHPLDRRNPRDVTVTYSIAETGNYALWVEDTEYLWALVRLGTLPAGATGTWTWTARERVSGTALERGRYDIHLVETDSEADGWNVVSSAAVQVHNSTERLVIDDRGDGIKIRVNEFVLSNGPTKVIAEYLLASTSRQPRAYTVGLNVQGTKGGYYATAVRTRHGHKAYLVYTRSLPGDAPAQRISCRGVKLRENGLRAEFVIPRRCLSRVRPTTGLRAFFGVDDGRFGYDQPEGEVQGYWTRWTHATKRGA